MMKKGWILLIVSLVTAFIGDVVVGLIGGMVFNADASDPYSQIGAIIGFMAPSIVYFGNKI